MKKLIIVKIGGNIIDDPEKLNDFLDQFASIREPKIIVHGGGRSASKLAEQLRVPVKMMDGRRITDKETLRIATMVYAGEINKNIVALLQSRNCNATGLSGADGNCILASKRRNHETDYGYVGDIESVNGQFLATLISAGCVPVLCAITHDGNGQLLNTNADTIASSVAIALNAFYNVKLIFCFEKEGVLSLPDDDTSVIGSISLQEYCILKNSGTITAGMIPKMDNAFSALRENVSSVTIGNAAQLLKLTEENKNAGTTLHI